MYFAKEAEFSGNFVIKAGESISFSSESIRSKASWTLFLKLFLDILRISHGKLFQIFTPYLGKWNFRRLSGYVAGYEILGTLRSEDGGCLRRRGEV